MVALDVALMLSGAGILLHVDKCLTESVAYEVDLTPAEQIDSPRRLCVVHFHRSFPMSYFWTQHTNTLTTLVRVEIFAQPLHSSSARA